MRRLNQTAETDGSARRISASLGIALFPHDADVPETLLQRTDIAMYEAKKCGGNGYGLFGDRDAGEQRRAG